MKKGGGGGGLGWHFWGLFVIYFLFICVIFKEFAAKNVLSNKCIQTRRGVVINRYHFDLLVQNDCWCTGNIYRILGIFVVSSFSINRQNVIENCPFFQKKIYSDDVDFKKWHKWSELILRNRKPDILLPIALSLSSCSH